jgi:hypothetical protein
MMASRVVVGPANCQALFRLCWTLANAYQSRLSSSSSCSGGQQRQPLVVVVVVLAFGTTGVGLSSFFSFFGLFRSRARPHLLPRRTRAATPQRERERERREARGQPTLGGVERKMLLDHRCQNKLATHIPRAIELPNKMIQPPRHALVAWVPWKQTPQDRTTGQSCRHPNKELKRQQPEAARRSGREVRVWLVFGWVGEVRSPRKAT